MNTFSPIDIEELAKGFDPDGMLKAAFSLSDQIEIILNLSKSWNLPKIDHIQNIIIMGMGGSAMGGELAASLLKDEILVPITLCREYDVPQYVNENTLAVAVSYSGNTEETLAAYEQCREKKADLIALTTGGSLKETAEKEGVPVCILPEGYQPRAASGLLFCGVMMILEGTGIIKSKRDQLSEAAVKIRSIAEKWKNTSSIEENLPLKMALMLHEKIPVFYGSSGMMGSLANRWKCQLNENSKKLAFWHYLPEMNHNDIMGWRSCAENNHNFAAVFLRDYKDSSRIKARVDFTGEIIGKKISVSNAYAEGSCAVEKLLYMVLLGDLLSIYIALLSGTDPSDIAEIHLLKKKLACVAE